MSDEQEKVISWPGRAYEIWAHHIGIRTPGEMGRILGPLVKLHGPGQVLIWLEAYCEMAPHLNDRGVLDPERYETRFLSPGAFVRNYKQWERLSNPAVDGS